MEQIVICFAIIIERKLLRRQMCSCCGLKKVGSSQFDMWVAWVPSSQAEFTFIVTFIKESNTSLKKKKQALNLVYHQAIHKVKLNKEQLKTLQC